MAGRPGSHGLFSWYGSDLSLDRIAKEAGQHSGPVWNAIFSLKREDAARVGYDNADAWQALLNANASFIANEMNIEVSGFRWYAAFHDEGNHPHVHFVAYAEKPGREYLSEKGVQHIRSRMAREIFKEELHEIYVLQTQAREELDQKAQQEFHDAVEKLKGASLSDPRIVELIPRIAAALQRHKGKKVYGYLSKSTKQLVDQAVDILSGTPEVADAYARWWELRKRVLETYRDDAGEIPPLSTQPEFKKIRNMVVREIWKTVQEQENQMAGEENSTVARTGVCTQRILWGLADLFSVREPKKSPALNARVDRKRLRWLHQKKIALGQAGDDLEIRF